MAYDLKFLQRVEISPNLDKTLNPGQGQDTITKPSMWVYDASASGANNSLAQTVAADYFLSAYGFLTAGDLVYCFCNDPGYQILAVSASSSATVTTSKISA